MCGLARNSVLDRAAHQRNARRAAHQHHFVDLLDRHAGVLDAVAARAERAVDDIGVISFSNSSRVISRW